PLLRSRLLRPRAGRHADGSPPGPGGDRAACPRRRDRPRALSVVGRAGSARPARRRGGRRYGSRENHANELTPASASRVRAPPANQSPTSVVTRWRLTPWPSFAKTLSSWAADSALRLWPEVCWARRARAGRLTGTATRRPDGSATVPLSVPKAIVFTGTPAAAASWAAVSFGTPTVVSPSDSTTMVALGVAESAAAVVVVVVPVDDADLMASS